MFNQPEALESINSASYLDQICLARNKEDDFVQLNEGIQENQYLSEQQHQASGEPETVIKLARLLLRLVNDTFLALPIKTCQKTHSQPPIQQDNDYDACQINWSEARILNLEENSITSDKEIDTSDFLSYTNIHNNYNYNNRSSKNVSSLNLLNINKQLDYNLVKLTYLSFSSLLSILGIIINLFIILIIIFNTKQKRRSVIRSNNTSQNNLLLFQLTFTGILLAGNVLLENLNIYQQHQQQHDLTRPLELSLFSRNYLETPIYHNVESAQQPKQQQLPLFNFLPPTPFQWRHQSSSSSSFSANVMMQSCDHQHTKNYQQLPECVYCDDDDVDWKTMRVQADRKHEGIKFHEHLDATTITNNQFDFVLILGFHPNINNNNNNNNDTTARGETAALPVPVIVEREKRNYSSFLGAVSSADTSGAWNLEYYVLSGNQGDELEASRRLIDLSGSLKSIFIAKSNCSRRRDDRDKDGERKQELVRSLEEANGLDSLNGNALSLDRTQENKQQKQDSEMKQQRRKHQKPLNDDDDMDDVVVLETNNFASQPKLERLGGPFWLLLMKLLPIFMNVIASVHIWTVAALAYDRYCAIAHPLQYLRSIHTSRVRTFFMASWTISLLLNLLWPLSLNQIINHQWTPNMNELQSTSSNSLVGKGTHLVNHDKNDDLENWKLKLNLSEHEFNEQQQQSVSNVNLNNGSQNNSRCLQFTTTKGCSYSTIPSSLAIVMKSSGLLGCSNEAFKDTHPRLRASLVWLMNKINGYNFEQNIEGQNVDRELANKVRNSLIVMELTSLLAEHQQSQWSSSLEEARQFKLNISSDSETTTSRQVNDGYEEVKVGSLYIVFLVTYSLLAFIIIILAPLLVITICNIMIYRIVKVHERRLSINSGSNVNTSASNLNDNHNYQIHNHFIQHKLRNGNNNNNRRDLMDDNKSDTSSITSLLVSQLVKVGFLKGQYRSNHQHEVIQQHYCSDQDINQSCCLTTDNCNNSKHCEYCDRNSSMKFDFPEDNNNNKGEQQRQTNGSDSGQTNMINRSKRVIIRQDSYQILSKLRAGGASIENDGGNVEQTRSTRPTGSFPGLSGGCSKQVTPTGNNCQQSGQIMNQANNNQQSCHQPALRVKRKTSDYIMRDFNHHRKDSNASQCSEAYFRSDFNNNGNDNLSFNLDSSLNYNEQTNGKTMHHESSSGGIMSQLKLAGLSFAGIAIQGQGNSTQSSTAYSGFNFGKPTLQKSSSCSLGNLNMNITQPFNNMCQNQTNNNNNLHQNNTGSASRCSMETASSVHTCPKVGKFYVSLNSTYNQQQQQQQQQQEAGNNKFLTRLLDDDSESPQSYLQTSKNNNNNIHHHHQHHHHHHHHHHHRHFTSHQNHNSRLSFTLGTKSPSFNVVIWLILSLLIVTLPHYLIVTVNLINELNPTQSRIMGQNQTIDLHQQQQQMFQDFMGAMVKSLLIKGSTGDNVDSGDILETTIAPNRLQLNGASGQTIWETSFIWLACLSRLLFLSILPLNGWLYGIRSRSLRAALRIVLKRYITRRQASIEINHRQRSISSMRSRDSSFMNLHHLYYNQHNSSTCPSCNYRISSTDSPIRVFRRCSSFSGLKRDTELRNGPNFLALQPFMMDNSSSSQVANNNNLASMEDVVSKQANHGDDDVEAAKQALNSRTPNNGNTIRFLIGDCTSERDFNTMTPPTTNQQTATFGSQYCSQNTSPALSLAGSHRSLLSASIHSANSLLFDDRRSLDCSLLDSSSSSLYQKSSAIKRTGPSATKEKMAYDNLAKETVKSIQGHHRPKKNILAGNQVDKTGLSSAADSVERNNKMEKFGPIVESAQQFVPPEVRSKEVIQRASSAEPKATLKLKSNIEKFNNSNKCHLSESPNEFRFYLTSADQRQHIIELGEPNSMAARKDSVTGLHVNGRLQTRLSDTMGAKADEQVSYNWWKDLKVNLSKIMYNTSARLLTSDLSNDNGRQGKHYVGTRSLWLESSDNSIEAGENQCNRALLRKSSIDGVSLNLDNNNNNNNNNNNIDQKESFKWHKQQNYIVDRLTSESATNINNNKRNRKHKNNKRLKVSMTLNNLDSIEKDDFKTSLNQVCSKYQSMHNKNDCRDCNGSSKTFDQQQSSTYLKPPNFLKLIFDPNNHSIPYSGTSALSPIKECSSNHSYASSQSSLNNNNAQQQHLNTIRTTSMGDMNIIIDGHDRET